MAHPPTFLTNLVCIPNISSILLSCPYNQIWVVCAVHDAFTVTSTMKKTKKVNIIHVPVLFLVFLSPTRLSFTTISLYIYSLCVGVLFLINVTSISFASLPCSLRILFLYAFIWMVHHTSWRLTVVEALWHSKLSKFGMRN